MKFLKTGVVATAVGLAIAARTGTAQPILVNGGPIDPRFTVRAGSTLVPLPQGFGLVERNGGKVPFNFAGVMVQNLQRP